MPQITRLEFSLQLKSIQAFHLWNNTGRKNCLFKATSDCIETQYSVHPVAIVLPYIDITHPKYEQESLHHLDLVSLISLIKNGALISDTQTPARIPWGSTYTILILYWTKQAHSLKVKKGWNMGLWLQMFSRDTDMVQTSDSIISP